MINCFFIAKVNFNIMNILFVMQTSKKVLRTKNSKFKELYLAALILSVMHFDVHVSLWRTTV